MQTAYYENMPSDTYLYVQTAPQKTLNVAVDEISVGELTLVPWTSLVSKEADEKWKGPTVKVTVGEGEEYTFEITRTGKPSEFVEFWKLGTPTSDAKLTTMKMSTIEIAVPLPKLPRKKTDNGTVHRVVCCLAQRRRAWRVPRGVRGKVGIEEARVHNG